MKRDTSALPYIQQRMSSVKKAKQAWKILKEGFQGNDKVFYEKL